MTALDTAATAAAPSADAPAAEKPLAKKIDSHGRAITKAVSWRIIGTLDTFLWSWLITHQPVSAASIASTEVLTKIGLYYVHERLWRLVKFKPDSHIRSAIKAFTWRFIGTMDTFLLSLLFTGSPKWAFSIAGAEVLTKIFLYYLHERAWRLVPWGRLEEKPKAA